MKNFEHSNVSHSKKTVREKCAEFRDGHKHHVSKLFIHPQKLL